MNCSKCAGTGEVWRWKASSYDDGNMEEIAIRCSSCYGTGEGQEENKEEVRRADS